MLHVLNIYFHLVYFGSYMLLVDFFSDPHFHKATILLQQDTPIVWAARQHGKLLGLEVPSFLLSL